MSFLSIFIMISSVVATVSSPIIVSRVTRSDSSLESAQMVIGGLKNTLAKGDDPLNRYLKTDFPFNMTKEMMEDFCRYFNETTEDLEDDGDDEEEGETEESEEHHSIHVASWNFTRVSKPLVIALILLLVGLVKVGFHYAECLSKVIPESCLLIVFGVIVGAIIHRDPNAAGVKLDPDFFLLCLLPPIVLDSAYSLHDRVVLDNIGTILLFAVVGTIINWFIIGPALYGLALTGCMGDLDINFVQCMLFASFIVAVDPVAVLAIFQDVGVNARLYFLVFGESLLNDAVTVVLYNMMIGFNNMEVISADQMVLGVISFFTVSCGAIAIGTFYGFLSALITRLTTGVRVVEPLAVLVIAYLSYVSAELFHWSGIISMIVCGIMQAEYTTQNLSRKSNTTVKYFIKMISTVSDCMIFVFLGLELVRTEHFWHTGFVLWSILLILVARMVSIFGLTGIVNCSSRKSPIGAREQFMMWYGGLRGAVCFALAATISDYFPFRQMFLTTTLIIIFFTVFIQGTTMKPLVSLCKIEKQSEKELSVAVELHCHTTDHVMAGMERIVGSLGESFLRTWINRVNDTYLRKFLQNNPLTKDERLLQVYQKVALKDHARHIYESTCQSVNVGQQDIGVTDSTEAPLPLSEDDDRIKPGASGIRQLSEPGFIGSPMFRKGTDDQSLTNNMRWAMAKSAVFSMHQKYDRNLTKDDDTDLAAALREKHARMAENRHVREPNKCFGAIARRHCKMMKKDGGLLSGTNGNAGFFDVVAAAVDHQQRLLDPVDEEEAADGVAGSEVRDETVEEIGEQKKALGHPNEITEL